MRDQMKTRKNQSRHLSRDVLNQSMARKKETKAQCHPRSRRNNDEIKDLLAVHL